MSQPKNHCVLIAHVMYWSLYSSPYIPTHFILIFICKKYGELLKKLAHAPKNAEWLIVKGATIRCMWNELKLILSLSAPAAMWSDSFYSPCWFLTRVFPCTDPLLGAVFSPPPSDLTPVFKFNGFLSFVSWMTSLFFLSLLLLKAEKYIKSHEIVLRQSKPWPLYNVGMCDWEQQARTSSSTAGTFITKRQVSFKQIFLNAGKELDCASISVTVCLQIHLMPQSFCTPTCGCKDEGRKHTLQFYYRGENNKCLKSEKYWGAIQHYYAWRWETTQLESCIGCQVALRCVFEVAVKVNWCDCFSPLVNPFLVLQLSPSFKETENVLQSSTGHLLEVFVNPLLNLVLHPKRAERSKEPELRDRPDRVCITCTALKIVAVVF